MHDRQPGAPGQYTMTIAADQLTKLLAGESCTIVLVRDDQPIAAGTPYNKASVLPDDLAASICPTVTDPTPADAFKGLLARRYTKTLLAAGWVGNEAPYTQTVAVDGILTTDCPHYGVAYTDAYAAEKEAFALIDDLETADGSVTFTCFDEKPQVDLNIQLEVNR